MLTNSWTSFTAAGNKVRFVPTYSNVSGSQSIRAEVHYEDADGRSYQSHSEVRIQAGATRAQVEDQFNDVGRDAYTYCDTYDCMAGVA
jgi:hypothetical protein